MKEADKGTAGLTGILLTVALHGGLIVLLSSAGLKYISPPPAESSFVLEFEDEAEMEEEEEIIPEVVRALPDVRTETRIPKAENPKMDEPAEKVQDSGLDPRASFPGMAKNKPEATAETSPDEGSAADTLAAGIKGNSTDGRSDGTPNAVLKGRNTYGIVPKPAYNVQEEGTVVVEIWVDNYGNVAKAVPGGDGTTVSNKTLNAAAREAALKTHFNMSADAPALQQGTITYIFKLK